MKKNNLIYIFGKISDKDPQKQWRNIERFFRKERELREMGYEVLNPCRREPPNDCWEGYLAEDLHLIYTKKPSHMYGMHGWTTSSGAKMEYRAGLIIETTFIFESDPEVAVPNYGAVE